MMNHFIQKLQHIFNQFKVKIMKKVIIMYENFITPMQKGIELAEVKSPPLGVYENVDLRMLPKFISYKAALLKEKLLWRNLSLILIFILCLIFTIDRYEISSLQKRYREKEFIVLPDFIPVSPHSISDKYVEYAVNEFIQLFGNINAASINEQYDMLSENMSLDFKRRFEAETYEWIEHVKNENITETLSCSKKEIAVNGDGIYEITALCKKQTYINHEYVGSQDEVLDMKLAAIPPKKARRWVLEIRELHRSSK